MGKKEVYLLVVSFVLILFSFSVSALEFDQDGKLIPDSSVVLLMHLDEDVQGDGHTIEDSSGNNLDGLTHVAVDCTRDGKSGTGCYFPFTGNYNQTYIGVPADSRLDLSSLTMAGWVYTYGATGRNQIIGNKYNSYGLALGTDYGAGSDLRAKGSLCYTGYGEGARCNNQVISPDPLNTNTWYHVAFSFDGTTMKLYLDGVLVDSKDRPGTIDFTDHDFQIGLAWYNWNFNGVIDDVVLFNRALTDSEVLELYNAEPSVCVENWDCGDWGDCVGGQQSRTCTDLNNCGTIGSNLSLTLQVLLPDIV